MGKPTGKDHGIYLRTLPSGKTAWYIRLYWQGREIKRKGGRTKEEARRTLYALKTDLERNTIVITPAAKEALLGAIERYRPMAMRLRNYNKSQCFFKWWSDNYGKIPLRHLTAAHLEDAQTRLLNEGKSKATVNRYTDWLRHVLNREIRLGNLNVNPCQRILRQTEADAPIYQYSIEEEGRLVKALGTKGASVRLAILTGLRQSEMFSIQKAWIDWQHGYIQIPTSKANKPRMILLTAEVRAIVHSIASEHPDAPYLFPSPKHPKQPWNAGAWYRRVFKPACRKAGLPLDLKFHSLRHTFGSRLAASGASSQQIKALGGWATDRAANRYIHFIRRDLLEVAERLSKPDTIRKTSSEG